MLGSYSVTGVNKRLRKPKPSNTAEGVEHQQSLFEKTIQTLKNKLEEGEEYTNSLVGKLLDTSKNRGLLKKQEEIQCAKELCAQMERNKEKKTKDLIERKLPGIADHLYGYPHMPQTPQDLRKNRAIDRRNKLKQELDQQNEEKTVMARETVKGERELDRKLLFESNEADRAWERERISKKQAEMTALTTIWDKGIEVKKIKDSINKSNKHLKKNSDNEGNSGYLGKLNELLSTIKTQTFYIPAEPKSHSQKVAMRLQQNLAKSAQDGYEQQIRNMITHAKSRASQFLPPSVPQRRLPHASSAN